MAIIGLPWTTINQIYSPEEVEKIIDMIVLGYQPKEIYLSVGKGKNGTKADIKKFRDWYEIEMRRELRDYCIENGIILKKPVVKQMWKKGKR